VVGTGELVLAQAEPGIGVSNVFGNGWISCQELITLKRALLVSLPDFLPPGNGCKSNPTAQRSIA